MGNFARIKISVLNIICSLCNDKRNFHGVYIFGYIEETRIT